MQSKKAAELKKSWGDQKCSHPYLDKEYINGMATGDYVCTTSSRNPKNQKSEQLAHVGRPFLLFRPASTMGV